MHPYREYYSAFLVYSQSCASITTFLEAKFRDRWQVGQVTDLNVSGVLHPELRKALPHAAAATTASAHLLTGRVSSRQTTAGSRTCTLRLGWVRRLVLRVMGSGNTALDPSEPNLKLHGCFKERQDTGHCFRSW